MKSRLEKKLRNQVGTTVVEYSCMAALLCLVALPAISYTGQQVEHSFAKVQFGGGSTTTADENNQGDQNDVASHNTQNGGQGGSN